MCMITLDLMLSTQGKTWVDIKQNVFEFRTLFE